MRKVPFLTLEKAQEIAAKVPTPFHIYDEAGIRSGQGPEPGLCLESGLSGVFCREGHAQSLHSADSP